MADQSVNRKEILLDLKKAHAKRPTFKRWQSDRYARVKPSWRKPRGLDNRVRKKYRGAPAMPNIRFRRPKLVRDLLPNGYRDVVIHNLEELRAVQSLNDRYCVTIGHAVGARKRIDIVNEAKLLGIVVTNEGARIMEAVVE